ncbi:Na+/H+ antiporter NhaA [Parasediminibacterium paludis]|uniref:Na(+)/H(+) antiporter NhaA n=1 Tax=Parasediminibacterium paludis TaxID=908966 RepID=A0ABV8PZG2_9BACT
MSKRLIGLTKLKTQIFSPLRDFFADSRAIGIVLIACTVVSLTLSNYSPTSLIYTKFWENEFHWFVHFLHLPETNLLFINDVLMTFFFFLVGMEIKRELTIGELASLQRSLLPVFAAFGGMLCPAIIFILLNNGTPFQKGWGIPMATDIAFSLGILSLLGKRVPVQLKIFLTALAIIDDLGAVLTIAVFYSANINFLYLGFSAVIALIVIGLNKFKFNNLLFYLVLGILLWYCMFNSGIHATLAGVIMSFCMPLNQLSKLEHRLFHPVNFVIMPLFALANTAIVLPKNIDFIITSTVSFGVIAGLVIGKPLGIFSFSYLAVKFKMAAKPANINWKQLLGVGMIGGIGFTMSIFTAALAYTTQDLQIIAKVAIIIASIIAGILGYIMLRFYTKIVVFPLEVSDLVD